MPRIGVAAARAPRPVPVAVVAVLAVLVLFASFFAADAGGPDVAGAEGPAAPGSYEFGLYAVDAAGGSCRERGGVAAPVPRDPSDPLQLRYLAEHFGGRAARLVALRTMVPDEAGDARCDATLAFAPSILYVGARASGGAPARGGTRANGADGAARLALTVRPVTGGPVLAGAEREARSGEDLVVLFDAPDGETPCLVATLTPFDARATGERQQHAMHAGGGPLLPVEMPPRLVVQYNPDYPLVAAHEHRAGEVILGLLVDEGGQVPVVEILSYPQDGEDLARSAVEAAHRWLFLPGTATGGRPVKALVTVVLRFRLPSASPL